MSFFSDAWAGIKAVATRPSAIPPPVRFPSGGGTWAWQAPNAIDWLAAAGPPEDNSILTIALRWIVTNFIAAPIGVRQGPNAAEGKFMEGHALTQVLRYGNSVYDGRTLLQSALPDYLFRGAAYFLKGRNAPRSAVLEWWYEPYSTIRPVWPQDGSAWIDHWEVQRDGQWIALPYTEDVITWTRGVPLAATRRPADPLAAFRQERALARQVNDYLATVLMNQGVVGGIVAPMEKGVGIKNPADLKARLETLTTGDNRGRWLVMGEPITVTFPNSAPDTMPVERLDGRTEERLTAALGLNRLVAGLGKDGTFANQEGAERQAWLDCVLPLQDDLTATLDRHLLPDFTTRPEEHVAFDTSGIRALQDNRLDAAREAQIYVTAGILTPNEIRADLGKAAHPDGDKLRGGGVVPPQLAAASPAPAPTTPDGTPVLGDTTPVKILPAPHPNGHAAGVGRE